MTSSIDPGLKRAIPTPSRMQVAMAKKIAIRDTPNDLLVSTAYATVVFRPSICPGAPIWIELHTRINLWIAFCPPIADRPGRRHMVRKGELAGDVRASVGRTQRQWVACLSPDPR
jgi:hypothetical protein